MIFALNKNFTHSKRLFSLKQGPTQLMLWQALINLDDGQS